jgi:uncharacterized membrane protein YidH (DUF202 family)
MTTADHEPLDLSTSAERTSLAWQRFGLGMTAVGALLIRSHLIHSHLGAQLLSVLAGCVLIGAGVLATVLVGPWRYRAILVRVRAGKSPRSRWVVLLAAAVVCTTAGAALGVVGLQ